jgi:hypothetical protein
VENVMTRGHVDTARRLIEEEELGFPIQSPRQEHPLLLTTGEIPDLTFGQGVDAQPFENGMCFSGVLAHGTDTLPARDPDINTHSRTVTGKSQLTVSNWGT